MFTIYTDYLVNIKIQKKDLTLCKEIQEVLRWDYEDRHR